MTNWILRYQLVIWPIIMFRNLREPQSVRRSKALTVAFAAGAMISLLSPLAAQAATGVTDAPQKSIELSLDELSAVSEQQISVANSGTVKFSSGDLIAKAREKISADRTARDERLAAEAAARAKAEEEARIQAEKEAAEAAAAAKAEEERKAAESRSRQSSSQQSSSSSRSSSAPSYNGGGSKDEWLRAAGIAESDWSYVDYIVSRESGWNPNAVNSSSGASGLVQALPCGKVPGSCFNPVDNLKWADGYAKGRYGSWANAYAFWTSNHWW